MHVCRSVCINNEPATCFAGEFALPHVFAGAFALPHVFAGAFALTYCVITVGKNAISPTDYILCNVAGGGIDIHRCMIIILYVYTCIV